MTNSFEFVELARIAVGVVLALFQVPALRDTWRTRRLARQLGDEPQRLQAAINLRAAANRLLFAVALVASGALLGMHESTPGLEVDAINTLWVAVGLSALVHSVLTLRDTRAIRRLLG